MPPCPTVSLYHSCNDTHTTLSSTPLQTGKVHSGSIHGRLAKVRCRPQVLAVPDGADFEAGLLQHSLDYDRDAVQMSDVHGLNLNVYVSLRDQSPADSRLPVFAFIHGGGFNGGSSSFPSYDLTRFVRLSIRKGMPVIAVSLKYVSIYAAWGFCRR